MNEIDYNYRQRIGNASNQYQGTHKRVLCVCRGGLLRSPTAAHILSQPPYDYNTRACGTEAEYALIKLDNVLLSWAQEIVVMEEEISKLIYRQLVENGFKAKSIVNLEIPDKYEYRNPELIQLIKERYQEK